MLLALIIILVLIGSAVISSIYSNFAVFYSNFQESENYHKAYYAAISALERWELVTKQRSPWYVWSGWVILWTWQWIHHNWWSDWSLSWFSYFWVLEDFSTIFWTINSRTNRIPSIWGWNVEWMLSADDSPNYNMMDYENSEIILLYYDTYAGNPYDSFNWSAISSSKPPKIEWIIRLPSKLFSGFWNLDTNEAVIWSLWLIPEDDAIVDWQIKWTINNKSYTIFSTQKVDWSDIFPPRDTIFRESDLNQTSWLILKFGNTRNPINNNGTNHGTQEPKTIISQEEETIKGYSGFDQLFSATKNGQIRFNLVNKLKWVSRKIYPFLEYYMDFWSTSVADKYYTIDAEWEFKDYHVEILIQKPTFKESIFSNFTSIF